MKSVVLTLLFLTSMAHAERQLGFLIPIGDDPPLDVKKFKAVECQYEVMCYPVYAIKELQNGKKIYEIRRVEASSEPHPLVRDGELPFNYQTLDVFLNTAMLDFVGNDMEITANIEQPSALAVGASTGVTIHSRPIWMNYIEHPKPLGVALSKEKKDTPDYEVLDKPKGKKISDIKVTWSNIMSWTFSVCDKFDCKVPYYEVVDDYYKVLAPPPKQRTPSSIDTYNKIPGDEPKYVWLRNKNLDGKADSEQTLVDIVENEMFRPHYPQLKDIDVVAVKKIDNQIWLQVDFLKAGRCDGSEKKAIGRGWIPVFKPDDSLNVLWYPRGC